MLSPVLATVIMFTASAVLLCVVPMLDASTRFGKYISLRYTIVSCFIAMELGCLLDFSHLDDKSRHIMLLSASVISCVFLVVRSLEKVKLGGKHITLGIKKNDVHISAELDGEKEQKTTSP